MTKFLYFSAYLCIALLLSIGIAWWIGRGLPREHQASVQVEVSADIAIVAERLRDVQNYPRWRSDIRGIDAITSNVKGLRYREHSGFGPLHFVLSGITTDVAGGLQWSVEIDDATAVFGGRWNFHLQTIGANQTRLQITETGFVDAPLWRFFSRYVFGHDRQLRSYAAALTQSFSDRSSNRS